MSCLRPLLATGSRLVCNADGDEFPVEISVSRVCGVCIMIPVNSVLFVYTTRCSILYLLSLSETSLFAFMLFTLSLALASERYQDTFDGRKEFLQGQQLITRCDTRDPSRSSTHK